MSKCRSALIVYTLAFGPAYADDQSLVVEKQFKAEIDVGGVAALFRTQKQKEQSWLELHPRSGRVRVDSVSLNDGSCAFKTVSFPAEVSSVQNVQIWPHCQVTHAEIRTDRGTYRFDFTETSN